MESAGPSPLVTHGVTHPAWTGPFVVLFDHDGGDEPGDRSIVGEDPDDFGAAFDLAVDPLEGVGGPDLAPVRLGERGECQEVLSGVAEQRGDVGELAGEHAGDLGQLGAHVAGVGLGEDRAHSSGDHLGRALGDPGEHVAHEMHPGSAATLPR